MASKEDIEKTSATWYAWGRNDAEGTHTDVFAFAEFYIAQRTSHGRSVQDAYKAFTTPMVGGDLASVINGGHLDPEVRETCAEYDERIDDPADLDAVDPGYVDEDVLRGDR